MLFRSPEYSFESKSWKEPLKTAVIFAPTALLSTIYKEGVNIGGKICTKYSIGTGKSSDAMYSIQYNDIPLCNEDGEQIYKHQAWTPDADMMDDEMPKLGQICIETINNRRAGELSNAGNPLKK